MRRGLALLLVAFVATLTPTPSARAAGLCDRFGPGAARGRMKNPLITEASGLAASHAYPGVYWTHNDSGGKPEVFAVRLDGTDLGSYALPGASARDWEDIAVGPKAGATGSFIYAGDIGDNLDRRDHVTVFRVPEPSTTPKAPGRALTGVETIQLTYPEGPANAEAMIVDPTTGDMTILTKSMTGTARILFAAASSLRDGARVTMRDRGVVGDIGAVTAADIAPDGSFVLVRTYAGVLGFPRQAGQSVPAALQGAPCDAPSVTERQGEAIAIAPDGSSYATTSEGAGSTLNVFAISRARATASTTLAPPTTLKPDPIPPRPGASKPYGLIAAAAAATALLVLVLKRKIGRDGEI